MAEKEKKHRNRNISGLKPFKKGQSGNPSGRAKLPPEIKKIKRMNRDEVVKLLDKFSSASVKELKQLEKSEELTALEMIIVVNLLHAFKHNNHNSRDFIIERLAGKVTDTVEVKGMFGHKALLDQLKDD